MPLNLSGASLFNINKYSILNLNNMLLSYINLCISSCPIILHGSILLCFTSFLYIFIVLSYTLYSAIINLPYSNIEPSLNDIPTPFNLCFFTNSETVLIVSFSNLSNYSPNHYQYIICYVSCSMSEIRYF